MPFFERNGGKKQHQKEHAKNRGCDCGVVSRGDNAEVIHNVILEKQMPDNVGHKCRIYRQDQGNKHQPSAGIEGLEPDLCAVGVG